MKRMYRFNHMYPHLKSLSAYNGVITRAMVNEWRESDLPAKAKLFLTISLTYYKEKPKPWEVTDEWFVEHLCGEKLKDGEEFMTQLLNLLIEKGYVSFVDDIYVVRDMINENT